MSSRSAPLLRLDRAEGGRERIAVLKCLATKKEDDEMQNASAVPSFEVYLEIEVI